MLVTKEHAVSLKVTPHVKNLKLYLNAIQKEQPVFRLLVSGENV